jgi:hypothetical protein
MSMTIRGNRIPRQASPSVRLATLSDESLLWELGMLHAVRSTGGNTDADEARIIDLESEYLRRHPIRDAEPVLH